MGEFDKVLPGAVLELAARLAGAALILLIGGLAIRYLSPPLRRMLERGRMDASVASFLTNSVRAALVVVLILAALQQLGMHTASVLTLLGMIGFAVALSLQGSLANFASGLLVLSFRMVRVGDWVEIGDVKGQVVDLLPFHIIVVTADNQRVTVPNTLLTAGPVRNHSAHSNRRAQWTFTLGPSDDLSAVKDALRERLAGDSRILSDPAPRVFLQEWTDTKRTIAVQAWTSAADYQAVDQAMVEDLGKTLMSLRRSMG